MKPRTKTNIKLVLDNLNTTIEQRYQIAKQYTQKGTIDDLKIATALMSNIETLHQMRSDLMNSEPNNNIGA